MKTNVKFIRAEGLEEALDALARYGEEAKIVAGGTALTLMMEHGLISPGVLLSIGQVPGLDAVETSDGSLDIGPMTTLRALERSRKVKDHFPALSEACGSVGNVRVRNQGTLGGNLAEADYASDPPTVLMVHDAEVTASSQTGARTIPISEFFLGFFTTALQPDELITKVSLPAIPEGCRSVYLKFKSRSSEDRPCVGVAALAQMEAWVCRDLRVAIGAACEIPQRLYAVEATARDQRLTDGLIAEIADRYAAEVEPLEDLRGSAWYRTEMIRVHVQRALREVRNDSR